jgi:hypothetical protein
MHLPAGRAYFLPIVTHMLKKPSDDVATGQQVDRLNSVKKTRL